MSSGMRLPAVAEARSLDRDAGEGAGAGLLTTMGRKGLAFDILGHDEELLALGNDLLEDGRRSCTAPIFWLAMRM